MTSTQWAQSYLAINQIGSNLINPFDLLGFASSFGHLKDSGTPLDHSAASFESPC